MGSTARPIYITKRITMWYRQVVRRRPENVYRVPHLALAFVQVVGGEMVVQSRIEYMHSLADCSPTILKDYIEDQENLPLERLVKPENLDWMRYKICEIMDGLMLLSAGIVGMEWLHVDVVFQMNQEREREEVEEVEETNLTAEELFAPMHARGEQPYPEEERRGEEYMENDCRRRMGLVNTFVYGSARGGSPAAWMGGGEGEVCAVYLEGMKVGEEVTYAPCIHRFHDACIRKWFRSSGLCPLCRFKIDDR